MTPPTKKRAAEDSDISVGFIGAGMMATAIMDGIIAKRVVSGPESISCSDVMDVALEKAKAKGIFTTKSNAEICCKANDAIILAVKPYIIKNVCKEIIAAKQSKALIISVAAGVKLETLEHALPGRRVVRIMPNTACLVGEGAAAYALGQLCTNEDKHLVEKVFDSTCGRIMQLNETLLDATTAVCGSAPAFVYTFIEALADGGVRVGLPRNQALQLAAQTVKGAAEMVLETGEHPGALKDKVCSPGGTTIAGCDELEKG